MDTWPDLWLNRWMDARMDVSCAGELVKDIFIPQKQVPENLHSKT